MTDRWCIVDRESSSLEIEISISNEIKKTSPKLTSQCIPLSSLTIPCNSTAKVTLRMHQNLKKNFWGGANKQTSFQKFFETHV